MTRSTYFLSGVWTKASDPLPPSELFLTSEVHQGVYSPVDPEHPDLDAFPEFAEASVKEVVISPGEALFIPVGFWHHVRSLEVSISVSFTTSRDPTASNGSTVNEGPGRRTVNHCTSTNLTATSESGSTRGVQ